MRSSPYSEILFALLEDVNQSGIHWESTFNWITFQGEAVLGWYMSVFYEEFAASDFIPAPKYDGQN